MKKVTKTNLTITIDRNLKALLDEEIGNRSKYVEYLIYQDLKQKSNSERIKKIII